MSAQDPEIQRLFDKYVQNSISEKELERMLHYIKEHGIPESINQRIREELETQADPSLHHYREDYEAAQEITARVEKSLRSAINPPVFVLKRWLPSIASAAILLIIAGAVWWFQDQRINSKAHVVENKTELDEIEPAGNRASLVLSDGRVIVLDDNQHGIVSDGQRISYWDGQTTVMALDDSPVEAVTIRTPRGGTYQVQLPDGTQVWLNAASTLTYPSRFNPEERVVHLEGEAYFVVKPINNNYQPTPFRVQSLSQTIEVLGTAFNVSAYADESETRTTLVEGIVSIQHGDEGGRLVLAPGEQSLVELGTITKTKVNVRDYIDWKNGEFVFRNENTQQVLQRIGRWYDLDVGHVDQQAADLRFSGSISRYGNLQTVLDIMTEAGNIHFELNNRTVSVHKQQKIKTNQ